MILRLHPRWKRTVTVLLFLLLFTLLSTVYFSEAINEIPDRWHLPYLNPEPASSLASPTDIFGPESLRHPPSHPIDDLIAQADQSFDALLQKQTNRITEAADAYRRRRGRHPPPGFDQWVSFAESRGCVMIEDFFDRIYHDLNPFWGIPPDQIRAQASASPHHIRIRDRNINRSEADVPFISSYFDMIKQLATSLPDLDIPINSMDESRVLVPLQSINKHMSEQKMSLSRQNLSRAPPIDDYPAIRSPGIARSSASFEAHESYWSLARQACSSSTEAFNSASDSDFSTPPVFPQTYPSGTHHGFVSNWTMSQDICSHAHLRNMHGTFVEPVSTSTSTDLVPMFSGSKLLANNDILLPAAMYWSDEQDHRFAAGSHRTLWEGKRNEVFWRGTGSGGRNTANNWTRFQRHRLVSMLNGTQVEMTLSQNKTSDGHLPHNFPLPKDSLYPLVAAKLGLLPDWIRSFSNVAFYWLECFPATADFGCSYTGPWYRRGRQVSMERMFLNKYLPDVDGNSFSGRFRAFLMSNSLPIKATIYTEWHDSRLVPWKHFAPMDNTFVDLWSILEFFLQRDAKAEKIGSEGRAWAEQVLRKEDMLVYVYRLLLEYARVSHPEREEMGYAEDLVAQMNV